MKNFKKILAVLMAVALIVTAFAACGNADDNKPSPKNEAIAKEDLKIGFIFLHDENSTYDKNFMDAAKAIQKQFGLTDEQVLFKINIDENQECYDTAAELAEAGCDLIFADSFGHESYMLQAARDFPDVQFCHATGTNAKTANVPNFHNAFASIYEGRYLAGVAAGMKLNEMIEAGKITPEQAKIGYVGAFPYAEVKSGFTSFFLGARSVCESVTMEVKYTNSWFDIAKEKESALALINNGCVLISQHADSEGSPKACEEKGVPNVAYNLDTTAIGPNTALISSAISWAPYFELLVNSLMNGTEIPTDWCGGIKEGSVILTKLNEKVAAEGTQAKLDEIEAQFKAETLKVFDTKTFTVDGKELTSYKADVIPDEKFEKDTEVIKNGEFSESTERSAPYFDIIIDGIKEI